MLIFVTMWFSFGALLAPLAYAVNFAYFQREYPTLAEKGYSIDRYGSVIMAVVVLLSFPVMIVLAITSKYFKHGLKFR